MANRYIRAETEIRIIKLGITDIPGFIDATLIKEIKRLEKKNEKKEE